MLEVLESLGERIAEQAAHLDAALHRLLTDLRTFDRGGGWHTQGARSCAHWLSWRVGWGLGTAREHVRVADRLADLPLLDDALRRGEISYSKIRAITRVATRQNEAALLEIARLSTGHQLETVCRKYRSVLIHDADPDPEGDRQRRWVARRDTADGMVCIEAVLHPEEAALVWAALDHRAQQQCRESHRVSAETSATTPPAAPPTGANARDGGPHVHPARSRAPFDRADALVQLAQGHLRGDRPDRSPVELVVSVPAETLRQRPATADADTVTAPEVTAPKVTASKATASKVMAPEVTASKVTASKITASKITAPEVTASKATASKATAPEVTDPCDVACFADGTCVSAETARRLSCDCGVVEIVEDEHGAPLSVGRKRRTIPGSMKRALLQRDRTCRFPGCASRLYFEAHHIVHWADGGDTSLRNMVACCSFHHRFLHEYGCSVELHADGPHFLDRRGRRILDAPPPSRPPGLGWETILARDAELQITASTNEPLWDGSRVDYGAVIDDIVSLEQAEAIQGWS